MNRVVKCFAVALLLTGCATAPIQVNAPDETEFQKQLDHDPRFQRLMDQITVPVGDSWHFQTSAGTVQRDGKTGYYVEPSAKKSW
jgi:hypothetical protein